jgi:hypothetical protein
MRGKLSAADPQLKHGAGGLGTFSLRCLQREQPRLSLPGYTMLSLIGGVARAEYDESGEGV